MKITLESTTRIVDINGVNARVWEGTTDSGGIPVIAIVPRIAVHRDQDQTQFQRELNEQHVEPSHRGVEAFPLRMFLP